MTATTFTNGVTLTDSDWFNDVNRLHYTIFGDPTATINAYDALMARGANVTSATTTDLTATTGDFVHVTGTTTITAITISDGDQRIVVFDGILTLTHGASLLLPGGLNITTAANDIAIFRGDASSVVRCVSYYKASGLWLGTLSALTAETAPDTADLIPMYDTSATSDRKVTLANTFKVINTFTEDTTPDITADYVSSYDASATAAKKVLLKNLNGAVIGTEQASTSGTSITFTGIPSGVTEIKMMLIGVSTNGTSNMQIRIGNGSVETTGYNSNVGGMNNAGVIGTINPVVTTGLIIGNSGAGDVWHGCYTLSLERASTNTWTFSGNMTSSGGTALYMSAGSKSCSGVVDRISLTTINGTDTFDLGLVNISYRY